MIVSKTNAASITPASPRLLIGSLGHLVIFLWALGTVFLIQTQNGYVLGGLCALSLCILYPSAIRRILSPRWLILMGVLVVTSSLFGNGSPDLQIGKVFLSTQAVIRGLKMILGATIILLASEGLAASMEITELAGVFERFGLQGLGFSLGVAVNMLPTLRQSALNAWHSLRMRGGWRAQSWRGVQLLILTILTNALRRSEEIVLAAEARAYRPDRSRPIPLRIGRLDKWLIPLCALSYLSLMVVSW